VDAEPVPVCDGNRLIGMVSYRDVATGVRRGGPGRARDVVAQDIIYCLETTTVDEASALMRDNEVRVVPVLNADRRLVGILHLARLPAPWRRPAPRARRIRAGADAFGV
jgi:CBS domain-containing protein